jgi:PAS domain S-box-containing protein
MIYYKDLNNNIIKCNQTFANFVGLHKQQIEGKNLRDIFDNEENILNYNIINNDSYNKLIFRCNKYIKETEIPNYSINKKLNGIIVLSVDVTEEILLKNKKYEDEEIYKTIIQEINEPIFIVDKDFNIIISNCKAKETFNLNGNKNNILDMLYDENSKNIITLIKDKKFLYVKEEIRIKSYEDNFITYELSYSPIKINEELATGIFILTDITERIEKEKFVKVTNTFLQKKNKELEDFVYIISHDLKVPLRQTKMFLDILEKNNDKEIMKKIKELSVKMQNLIDDLLKLSKAITEHESKDY